VRDGVLKSGYTSAIFVDIGARVDGTYYYDLLLSQQLLPVICHVSSEFVFLKTVPQNIGHAMLSDISISHGGICNDVFIANFLLSVTVKEF